MRQVQGSKLSNQKIEQYNQPAGGWGALKYVALHLLMLRLTEN
jgi:hypothetical protein